MMLFYGFSLALSCTITSITLALLFRALKINRERKNRHGFSYLTPVALTLAFLMLSLRLTVPQLLDTVPLITRTYQIEEVTVDESELGWNSLTVGSERYFYNQWQIQIEADRQYRIEYTPRSRYIIQATPVETFESGVRQFGRVPVAVSP